MGNMRELHAGEASEAAGCYQEVNVFGTPTGRVVIVSPRATLPATAIAHAWRPFPGAARADDLRSQHRNVLTRRELFPFHFESEKVKPIFDRT